MTWPACRQAGNPGVTTTWIALCYNSGGESPVSAIYLSDQNKHPVYKKINIINPYSIIRTSSILVSLVYL